MELPRDTPYTCAQSIPEHRLLSAPPENIKQGHILMLQVHILVLIDKHIRNSKKLAKGEILEEQSIKPIAKLVCKHDWLE